MSIAAGRLNKIIEVHHYKETKNKFGGVDEEYVFGYKTRANKLYSNGSFTLNANELFHTNTINFEIRIYHQISEVDRIKYNGEFYRILSLQPDVDLQKITITTELVNE